MPANAGREREKERERERKRGRGREKTLDSLHMQSCAHATNIERKREREKEREREKTWDSPHMRQHMIVLVRTRREREREKERERDRKRERKRGTTRICRRAHICRTAHICSLVLMSPTLHMWAVLLMNMYTPFLQPLPILPHCHPFTSLIHKDWSLSPTPQGRIIGLFCKKAL